MTRLWFCQTALASLAAVGLACASAPAAAPTPGAAPASAPAAGPGWSAVSDTRRLEGRLAPESGAVEVGQFQTWILELREPGGTAVTGALIAIAGGMPGHGHGLPTQPRVTEELGDGRYRIEGVKFNMHGVWVIEAFVQTAVVSDRLRFDLTIDF